MIQIMLWDLQADGNFKYLILGLYCRCCWPVLSAGIIAGCPSKRNDEWLASFIPYMAVHLYDDTPPQVP